MGLKNNILLVAYTSRRHYYILLAVSVDHFCCSSLKSTMSRVTYDRAKNNKLCIINSSILQTAAPSVCPLVHQPNVNTWKQPSFPISFLVPSRAVCLDVLAIGDLMVCMVIVYTYIHTYVYPIPKRVCSLWEQLTSHRTILLVYKHRVKIQIFIWRIRPKRNKENVLTKWKYFLNLNTRRFPDINFTFKFIYEAQWKQKMEYLVILRNLDSGQDIPPHAGSTPLYPSHHNNFGEEIKPRPKAQYFSSHQRKH
jgi:hypothetical protein